MRLTWVLGKGIISISIHDSDDIHEIFAWIIN